MFRVGKNNIGGVNAKWFYLILYLIAHRYLSHIPQIYFIFGGKQYNWFIDFEARVFTLSDMGEMRMQLIPPTICECKLHNY